MQTKIDNLSIIFLIRTISNAYIFSINFQSIIQFQLYFNQVINKQVQETKEIQLFIMATLYEQLGQKKGITSVVNKFYYYMLADPITAPFFATSDIQLQKQRQVMFLSAVLGGPMDYRGLGIRKGHQNLHIGSQQFEIAWKCFQKSLVDHKVSQELIMQIREIFYQVKEDVCQKPENQESQLKQKNIYQKLGGQEVFNSIMEKFHQFMLIDPVTGPFFANIDMKKKKHQQMMLIGMIAAGSQKKFQKSRMKKVHQHMNIGLKQFDSTWKHLQASLLAHNISQDVINEFYKAFESMKEGVINKD